MIVSIRHDKKNKNSTIIYWIYCDFDNHYSLKWTASRSRAILSRGNTKKDGFGG